MTNVNTYNLPSANDLIAYYVVIVANPTAANLNQSVCPITAVTATNVSAGYQNIVLTLGTTTGTNNATLGIQLVYTNGFTPKINYFLTLTAPSGGVDLSQFQVGGNQLQIIAPSANAGLWKVFDAGLLANGDTYVKVGARATASPFTAITSGTSVQLFQSNPSFSTKVMVESPNFHRGPVTGLLGAAGCCD